MEQRQLQWNRDRNEAPRALSASDAPGDGGSDLLRQARGWSAVARDAYETLARGDEAELELRRRRNHSGQ